jgi:hypothetical protein
VRRRACSGSAADSQTAGACRGKPPTLLAYYTLLAYNQFMRGVFVELPAFERYRSTYLDDDAFLALQNLLMNRPEAGDPIPDAGGLRKLRFADGRRGKGKRGGLR